MVFNGLFLVDIPAKLGENHFESFVSLRSTVYCGSAVGALTIDLLRNILYRQLLASDICIQNSWYIIRI